MEDVRDENLLVPFCRGYQLSEFLGPLAGLRTALGHGSSCLWRCRAAMALSVAGFHTLGTYIAVFKMASSTGLTLKAAHKTNPAKAKTATFPKWSGPSGTVESQGLMAASIFCATGMLSKGN